MNRKWPKSGLSWLVVAALIALCGVLGYLQYRWIGEVSIAERERLAGSLNASLSRLSQEFNTDLTAVCRTLLPSEPPEGLASAVQEIAYRYESNHHERMFSRIAVASPRGDDVELQALDPRTGKFAQTVWPAEWQRVKERLESRMSPEGRFERRPPGPPGSEEPYLLEVPVLLDGRTPRDDRFPRPMEGPPLLGGRRPAATLLVELRPEYVREELLPELLQRHLGAGGLAEYLVAVIARTEPPQLIFESEPGASKRISRRADASVNLFQLQYDQLMRRRGRPGPGDRDAAVVAGRRGGLDFGRWRISVLNRAGSLDAVVARTRTRNLAVTAGVLVLMLAGVAALVRFTRRAQRLAQLQMDFVAGVSHELRTPLTVIHTAAYNLRGKVAANPVQVEKYGTLIQQESGRLKDLVEQVLRFASATAGRVIQSPEPVSIPAVIDESIESSMAGGEGRTIEKHVDPDLPPIPGDPVALRHALQNLLTNAVKYGTVDSGWIGVFASRFENDRESVIEIRVVDRGPGIPADELSHVFDPFFRGRKAIQDQIHGSGLGLSLTKKIVEAHGGTIEVKSAAGTGTEFIITLPVQSALAPV